MLLYLDNAASVGPASPLGQRAGKGLNENHARELLELHTLGVDGGYEQADVAALAAVLTGWRIGTRAQDDDSYGRFMFHRPAHEPAPQTIMGQVFDQSGMAQGAAVLDFLSRQEATAGHVARKLARHFVADDPDADLVGALKAAFLDSDGDLLAVSRALVSHPLAWSAPATKLRSPQEFVWASLRALDLPVEPRRVQKLVANLGQPFWDPPSPAGFSDDSAVWLAPDGITNRLDAAQLMSMAARGPDDPRELARLVLGEAASAATVTAIERAESRAQALALMLMSPEFQRR